MPPSINAISSTCPVCHQPILSQYYFCPNCGTRVNQPPLKTSAVAQAGLYAFSVVLPLIGFIFVTRWQGNKYFKSTDEKAHQIGQIAWALIVLSTIATIWAVTVWTQNYIKTTVDSINSDMSGL